jgi:hypothetical protein
MSGHRIVVIRLTHSVDVDMRESGSVLDVSQSVRQLLKTDMSVDARILLRVVLRAEVRVEPGAIELLCNHKREELPESQAWLVLQAHGRFPLRHKSGVRPLIHGLANPKEMQKAADRSGGRIANHSDDEGVTVPLLEEPLALMDIVLRSEQLFVPIAVNPLAISDRLIEQAVVREEPLQHSRAAALRRPAHGDGKPGFLEREKAILPAGRGD